MPKIVFLVHVFFLSSDYADASLGAIVLKNCFIKLYTKNYLLALTGIYTVISLALTSCNYSIYTTLTPIKTNELLEEVNHLRTQGGLSPLSLSEALNASAATHAKSLCKKPSASTLDSPLERIVANGAYARFALSCEIESDNAEQAFSLLFSNPLNAGKLHHTGTTHIGFGLASSHQKTYLVVDIARLINKIESSAIAKNMLTQFNRNRKRIGVSALQTDSKLKAAADKLASEYMNSNTDSELLIKQAQTHIASKNFSLGKITIAFQVAGSLEEIVFPERISDPGAKYIGIAIGQGNRSDQDAGAIAMALLLATPQNNGQSKQRNHLPAPKAMPEGHKKTNTNASLEDQAWLATLVGNHQKAAALFEKAYRKTKDAQFLYESARAHARNKESAKAVEKMKKYAAICEGEKKKTASDMVKKLQRGESIFSMDEEEMYSVEAKRFFILGQKLFADGQWEGAIDAFSQAYAYSPHPDLIYNMGLAHLKANNVGDALDFFQEYQRLVPKTQSTEQAKKLFQIGVELYNIGQYESAAKRFTMAYSYLPIDEILFNLALCHKAMNDKKEALQLFQELADKTTDKKQRKEYKKHIKELE